MTVFDQAQQLHRAGKLKEAATLYAELLQKNADDHRALHWLGIATYQSGNVRRAEGFMQRAVELAPDEPGYHFGLGRMLQETGRPRRAVDRFRDVLRLTPDNGQARYRLAMVLHRVGDHDEALEHYESLIAERRDDPTVHINMGALLNLMGRSEDAIPLYERAIKLNAELPAAYGNLGNALAELKRFDEAVEAFNKCIELAPEQPKIHANLGSCELARGNLEKARDNFETCLRRNPGDITSLAMLAAIDNEQGRGEATRALLNFDELLSPAVYNADVVDTSATATGLQRLVAQSTEAALDEDRTAQRNAFLRELHDHVMSHPTLAEDPDSHSTRLGKQTRSLWPSDNEAIRRLIDFINVHVRAYRYSRPANWQPVEGLPPLWPAPNNWRIDMWATVLHQGGHQLPHIHPSGWLSGVFYVDIPMPDDNPDEYGYIEFGCTPGYLPLKAEPITHRHRPQPGELVLFPSYFFHRTVPLADDKIRTSIAFDVIPA